jgi:hypothetical protein
MDIAQDKINHNLCTPEKCEAYPYDDPAINNLEDKQKQLLCSANFCVVCYVNMGDDNPRQLCRKTYCPREDEQYEYKKNKN